MAKEKKGKKGKAEEPAEEKKASKGKGKKSKSSENYVVLDKEVNKVRLNRVRLSFPNLFTPKVVGDADKGSTPKFSASFLLDDEAHADTIEFLHDLGESLAKGVGLKKLSVSKSFIKPGDEKAEIEGFEGCHFVTASNLRRPLSIDQDKSAVTEADGKLYPGCYVNAVIQVWAQDNKWGKRVNASLEGVQFVEDGESLGGGTVADEDDFA